MGPTACGKTAVAMALCEALNAQIISVDSAMVFRGMDIGTAKPTPEELARAPHRLIDIVDPDDVYSAGQFRRDALDQVEELSAQGQNAVLAGGTMLYFRALLNGIDALPDADEAVRAAIDVQAAQDGWPAMHRRLTEVDPDAAVRIHPNDAQRIQRALEVHTLTGRPLSSLQRERTGPPPWPVLRIGLLPADRAALHARIARRFDQMLEDGFVDEVKGLLDRFDLTPQHPALRAVGYRQVAAHLRGETSLAQAREDAVTATRRLARRQLTWLRKEPDLIGVDAEHKDPISQVVNALKTRGVAVKGL